MKTPMPDYVMGDYELPDRMMRARKIKVSSAGRSPESRSPAKVVAAVATGSLPVSSVLLITEALEDLHELRNIILDADAKARRLQKTLHRLMAFTTERQPEENGKTCQPGT